MHLGRVLHLFLVRATRVLTHWACLAALAALFLTVLGSVMGSMQAKSQTSGCGFLGRCCLGVGASVRLDVWFLCWSFAWNSSRRALVSSSHFPRSTWVSLQRRDGAGTRLRAGQGVMVPTQNRAGESPQQDRVEGGLLVEEGWAGCGPLDVCRWLWSQGTWQQRQHVCGRT